MEKPLVDDSNIKFVRMNTGEDLIAEVVTSSKKKEYLFLNPLKLLYLVGDRPGTLVLSLIHWVFPRICNNQEFTINSNDVILISPLSEAMIDYYWSSLAKLDDVEIEYERKFANVHKRLKQTYEKQQTADNHIEEFSDISEATLNEIMDELRLSKRKLN